MPTMPNVVGSNWQQATAALIQAGVVPDNGSLPSGTYKQLGYFDKWPVTLTWAKSAIAKPGIVTAQSPASSASVALNDPIALTVASPPMSVCDRYSAGGYS